MAKSRVKAEPSKLRKWLKYVIVLFLGGGTGVGGWQLKDHPILQRVVSQFLENNGGDEGAADGDGLRKVAGVVSRLDSYVRPGSFEVTISDLQLDAGTFKTGQTIDLQARLIKIDSSGKEQTVWDTKSLGAHKAVAGRDGIQTDWSDSPFEVTWKPGDDFVLEVWEHKRGLGTKKRFEWVSESKKIFPLRSGKYDLSAAEDAFSSKNAQTQHQFVLESRPKSNPDAEGRVAGRDRENVRTK